MKKSSLLLLILAGIFMVYFLGALTTAFIYAYAPESPLFTKGPGVLTRRLALVWAIPVLILFFKYAPWKGWSDLGWWTAEQGWQPQQAKKDTALGLLLGFISLLPVHILMFYKGTRAFASVTYPEALLEIPESILEAIAVSLKEETLGRGVLLIVIGRMLGLWPTAFLLSMLTAVLHFSTPPDSAFEGAYLIPNALHALAGLPQSIAQEEAAAIKILNLTLMGLVLSYMVIRTQTIWVAFGAHAAWVFLIQLNGYFADTTTENITIWIGKKAQGTDSLLVTLLFILVLLPLTHILTQKQKPTSEK